MSKEYKFKELCDVAKVIALAEQYKNVLMYESIDLKETFADMCKWYEEVSIDDRFNVNGRVINE